MTVYNKFTKDIPQKLIYKCSLNKRESGRKKLGYECIVNKIKMN